MKCSYHSSEDSAQGCSVCGRPLCAGCSHSIKGAIYCQECLVRGAELVRLSIEAGPEPLRPKRAALFACIPGIGAVYNRQYEKAAIHFAVLAGLWTSADRGPEVFHLAGISFWVFTIIDAYRSAQDLLQRRLTAPPAEEGSKSDGLPFWGGLLILLGLLFFLENLGFFSFSFLQRYWPLGLVALGLYLIYSHYHDQETRNMPPSERAATTAEPQGHGGIGER